MHLKETLLRTDYGLANQRFCYIEVYKPWEKKTKNVLKIVGEYEPMKRCLK